jgi:7,8-dihydroneopterin aldolase/epimerase/oxygenase
LKNCAFFAHHGVFPEEETLGQRFFVDCDLWLEGVSGLGEDQLDATVDYGAAFQIIQRIVTGSRRHLIEALALDVATALHDAFPQITRAEVTIRKPNAPVQGILDHVEVTVAHPEGQE